jgi:hypothetical protein
MLISFHGCDDRPPSFMQLGAEANARCFAPKKFLHAFPGTGAIAPVS